MKKGRPQSEETRRKISEGRRKYLLSEGCRRMIGEARRNSPDLDEIQKRIAETRKDGTEEHHQAHLWKIKSPEGKTYEIYNLKLWAEENEHLFLPYLRPGAKSKASKRIRDGIGELFSKRASASAYYGWTPIEKIEFINRV